jgi:hypothetical protein
MKFTALHVGRNKIIEQQFRAHLKMSVHIVQ